MNGWNTAASLHDWVSKYVSGLPLLKTLFVMDLYKAHRSEEVLQLLKDRSVDVAFVPAGCTGVVQVHDVAMNKHFKETYRTQFETWRAVQAKKGVADPVPTRQKITRWVRKALDEFPEKRLLNAAMTHIIKPMQTPRTTVLKMQSPAEAELEGLALRLDDLQLQTVQEQVVEVEEEDEEEEDDDVEEVAGVGKL